MRISCVSLASLGDNITSYSGDIAELFPAEQGLSNSEVVCLKENGKTGYCDNEYDTTVLGVISTKPGIIIGNSLDANGSKMPIALKGSVPIKVICNLPIKRGDLLVSAGKKGYAMKKDLSALSINEIIEKIEGTTLGKALEACEKDESKILVWVG